MGFGGILSALVLNPRPLEQRLVDVESKIGGEVFYGKNHPLVKTCRFWYFEGDWFFEQYYQNAGYQVIRYQILDNSIHKLFNGIEYPFAEGEKETLIQAIHRYYTVVSQQLYGVTTNSPLAA
jgi:hypothetical protein